MKNVHRLTCRLLVLLFLAAGMVQAETKDKTNKKGIADPYPLTTCLVSGETLDAEAVRIRYQGDEIRFCCKNCKKKFLKAPEKYLPKLYAAKGSVYPLDTCVVSGGKLGSMGDPYVFQHEGTEVRFCCKGCDKKFFANPEKYVAKIRAAQAEKDKARAKRQVEKQAKQAPLHQEHKCPLHDHEH